MSCYAMIFSPCGGTEHIVHAFCKEWKEEVIEIDLSNPDCTGKNTPLCEKDICIIAMPSYGGEHQRRHCSVCRQFREIMLRPF